MGPKQAPSPWAEGSYKLCEAKLVVADLSREPKALLRERAEGSLCMGQRAEGSLLSAQRAEGSLLYVQKKL